MVLQTYDCNCDSTIKPLSPMDGRNTTFCELQCDTLSRSVTVCPGVHVCTSDLRFSAEKTLRLDHTRPHPTTLARLASPHRTWPLASRKLSLQPRSLRPLYSALRDDICSVGLFSISILWRLVVRWWQERSIECTEFSSGSQDDTTDTNYSYYLPLPPPKRSTST